MSLFNSRIPSRVLHYIQLSCLLSFLPSVTSSQTCLIFDGLKSFEEYVRDSSLSFYLGLSEHRGEGLAIFIIVQSIWLTEYIQEYLIKVLSAMFLYHKVTTFSLWKEITKCFHCVISVYLKCISSPLFIHKITYQYEFIIFLYFGL